MNTENQIYLFVGGLFFLIGSVITIIFCSIGFFGSFILLPLLFVVLGGGLLVYAFMLRKKQKDVLNQGKKYAAKIYGYVDDKSVSVNGVLTKNIVVHYFDDNGIEREATIPTQLESGFNSYAIGMTVDIYVYQGRHEWDPNSIRNEVIWRESELMDGKPIDPDKQQLVSIHCKNCGATYQAVKGYSNRCPYCGSFIDA